MVELQQDIAGYIPRNLSYTNFHSYYWPDFTVTRNCVKNKSDRNNHKSDQGMSAKNYRKIQNGDGTDLMECNAREELVPSRAECEAMRSLSVVSDSDTTFSEDYTRMTETSATSENLESDFSTPTGSVCSDFDDLSIGSQPDNYNDMNFEKILGKEKHKLSNSQAKEEEMSVQMENYEDNPPEPNSPDQQNGAPSFTKSLSSTSFEDREFDFLRAEPVRRSTSLKTNKTPPGTPSRKKAVRFADALGLDLESVRHILNLDVPPEIPGSALKDLKVGVEEFKVAQGNWYIAACFDQPGAEPDFIKRVLAEYVCLENCMIDDKTLTLTGTIRVANISFHKYVVVRCTDNQWSTSVDICASYIANSNDGPTDRFSFQISIPKYFVVGNRMQFAIRYATGGQEYWDNNRGKNYSIECFARSVPIRDSDTEWIHFL